MVKIGYTVFIALYPLILVFVALWNRKAKSWMDSRQDQSIFFDQISKLKQLPTIWIHVASSGEFQQALPLIQVLKKAGNKYNIVVTFFSPSGYSQWHRDPLIDAAGYLPWDRKKSISSFLNILNPDLVLMIKNEFWFNLLNELQLRDIKVCYVSTTVRPKSHIFYPWFNDIIRKCSYFFVQDESSASLLKSYHIDQVLVTGDTRIDHIMQLPLIKNSFPDIENVMDMYDKIIVYGSIYAEDIPMIGPYIKSRPEYLHIMAPHDISVEHINRIEQSLSLDISKLSLSKNLYSPIIIDSIGILNQIYKYADLVYIGGGFNKGIHNTLEPAVYGIPIIFGPKYHKFIEAVNFLELKVARSIKTGIQFEKAAEELLQSNEEIKKRLSSYFERNKGASNKIMDKLVELGLWSN